MNPSVFISGDCILSFFYSFSKSQEPFLNNFHLSLLFPHWTAEPPTFSLSPHSSQWLTTSIKSECKAESVLIHHFINVCASPQTHSLHLVLLLPPSSAFVSSSIPCFTEGCQKGERCWFLFLLFPPIASSCLIMFHSYGSSYDPLFLVHVCIKPYIQYMCLCAPTSLLFFLNNLNMETETFYSLSFYHLINNKTASEQTASHRLKKTVSWPNYYDRDVNEMSFTE